MSSILELRRGRVVRLGGMGRIVQALQGRVWITEENSARDIVLDPGQSVRLVCPGLALVEAFTDAAISIH
jgi:hypothetical protein